MLIGSIHPYLGYLSTISYGKKRGCLTIVSRPLLFEVIRSTEDSGPETMNPLIDPSAQRFIEVDRSLHIFEPIRHLRQARL